jgi:hypothetical protein
MARRAISTEVIPFGWVEISDAALQRLRSELEQKGQGVVDEMGVLAIHAGYADYFFPGTSVLQTRPRYHTELAHVFADRIRKQCPLTTSTSRIQ